LILDRFDPAQRSRRARPRDKAKGLKGDAKAEADKNIDELAKRHEALDAKLKDLDNVTEDKFEGLSTDLEELGKAAEKETGSETNPKGGGSPGAAPAVELGAGRCHPARDIPWCRVEGLPPLFGRC
jgi:hypothetical protein